MCSDITDALASATENVDAGKTTLLDKVRSTAIAAREAGGITQAIGATEIPVETIKKICGHLLEQMKIHIEIPGFLIIDTPGHEAFTSLRRRGGSCADLAILVVDVIEGFQPQTLESIQLLRQFKTPFIVAATKIDKIKGWNPYGGTFTESFAKQPQFVKDSLEEKIYKIVSQMNANGFEGERFDRISDFKKTIAVVPCSGISGEGISELLMTLAGLAQVFLKKQIEIASRDGIGSVLEVKEFRGLGTTIDVILYDGEIHRGDWLVVGGRQPVITKIKALLRPKPLKELRVEKQFESVESASAAAGIKISAPGLDEVKAGSPVVATSSGDIEKIKNQLRSEVEEIEFERTGEGIVLKADTLGSLEALIQILKGKNIEIKKAEVGNVYRNDIMGVEGEPLKKIVFAFNVNVDKLAEEEAKNRGVKIFQNNVIYKLVEEYELWIKAETEKIRIQKLESVTRPAKILLLKGFVFRASHPAIIGVEILAGQIKSGVALLKDGKEIGTVKEIQSEGRTIEKALKGERVALSIEGPTLGRQIREGDELFVKISENDLRIMEELRDLVPQEEIALAKEILGKQEYSVAQHLQQKESA